MDSLPLNSDTIYAEMRQPTTRKHADLTTRRDVLTTMAGSLLPAATVGLIGCQHPLYELVFANPAAVWWNAVPLLTSIRTKFNAKTFTIRSFDVPTGVKSKEAVIDGNADVGVCAANALATSTPQQLSQLVVLASITQSTGTVSLIAEGDHVDLEHSVIGYVKGTISEFYLISYLRQQNLLPLYSHLQFKALPPVGVPTAFDRHDVRVAIPWEPFAETLILACHKSGRRITVVRDSRLYNQNILVVAARKALASKRTQLNEFSQIMKKTCDDIESNRAGTSRDLEKYFKFDSGFIGNSDPWSLTHYRYITDRGPIEEALEQDRTLAVIANLNQGNSSNDLRGLLDQL